MSSFSAVALSSSAVSTSPGANSVTSASRSSSASAPLSSAPSVPPSSPSSLPISSSSPPVSSSSVVSSSSSAPTSSAPSSVPPSPSPSPSSTLTTPSTIVSDSTLITTLDGQTITSVVHTTSTIPAGSTVSASAPPTSHPTSHTGAIVGGTIGGLAFVALLGAGFLWYRRRSRYKSEFDGNFDPARVTTTRPISSGPQMVAHSTGGTLPRMNIEDDDDGMGNRLPHSTIGGGIITPFAYAPSVSAYGSSRSQTPPVPSGSMSQYSQDYAPTLSSGGYYTAVPQQAQAVGGYYPPAAPSSSGSSGNPRSAKEREARRSAGFAVANPSHDNEPRTMSGGYDDQYQEYLRSGPHNARSSLQGDSPPLSPTASSSGAGQRMSGVIVHQDGGRVEPIESVREEEADEIPPTYDSLPSEGRK